MTNLTGIYGAGGCGRGIMPLARSMPALSAQRLVFIDENMQLDRVINGQAVMSYTQFLNEPEPIKQIAIAIAEPEIRHRVARRLTRDSIPFLSIWAEQSRVMDDVEIGEGALISPNVTFTSNIRVGRCFHANINSYVEHDCVIGDFVTFAPGVQCNGHVRIGDFAYIGAGAMIRQGITIGSGAIVGMGAVVVKDVPDGATVVGNPARIMEK